MVFHLLLPLLPELWSVDISDDTLGMGQVLYQLSYPAKKVGGPGLEPGTLWL